MREIAGEAILVSVGEEIADFCGIVNLNASAKVLWKALQEPATADGIVQNFMETFEISEKKAREDVENTLRLLREHGMVTCV